MSGLEKLPIPPAAQEYMSNLISAGLTPLLDGNAEELSGIGRIETWTSLVLDEAGVAEQLVAVNIQSRAKWEKNRQAPTNMGAPYPDYELVTKLTGEHIANDDPRVTIDVDPLIALKRATLRAFEVPDPRLKQAA